MGARGVLDGLSDLPAHESDLSARESDLHAAETDLRCDATDLARESTQRQHEMTEVQHEITEFRRRRSGRARRRCIEARPITLHREEGMNSSQKERHETLFRVRTYVVDFSDQLGDVPKSQAATSLDRVVVDLEGLAGYQQHAPTLLRSRAVQKEDLREALRLEHMQPVAAVARLKLADSPLIVRLLLPPKGLDDASLIAAGDGMAEAATQYKDVFLAQNLAPTFLDDLRAAVDAVRNSVVDREGTRVQRSFTRREIVQKLSEGTHLVQILEGLVMKQIRGNPALVAAWRTAKGRRNRPGGSDRRWATCVVRHETRVSVAQ